MVTEEVLSSGRYLLSEKIKTFEKQFSEYSGIRHCVAVASGTDALILSLRVLGVKNGDEVITTPFTAIPTVSAIVATGARPVFVDINPETYLIDTSKVNDVITDKTKTIVPVHLFTQMVDIEKMKANLPRSIPIIEDAAQASGCSLNGKMAGFYGDLAACSFYPTKNLGGYGDSGAVLTNNSEYDHKLRLLQNYGKESPDNIEINGTNSRMDELQAAFLSLKLKDLEVQNQRRRKIAGLYKDGLENLPVVLPAIQPGAVPNYHIYSVQVPDRRDLLKAYLQDNNVQTDIFYPFPHAYHPAYQYLGYAKGDFPIAENVGLNILALPMYPELKKTDVEKIIDLIRKFYA